MAAQPAKLIGASIGKTMFFAFYDPMLKVLDENRAI
jgi:hypothetical protein